MNNANMINYQGYLKPTNELPKHITFQQYKNLREEIIGKYYDNINMPNKRDKFLRIRDKLLIDFAWATGGRIGDVVRLQKSDIDFENKIVNFRIKKTKIMIKINIDNDLMYELSNFFVSYKVEKPFDISPTAAWYICKKFGKEIGINLHPHMFRHGLGLYLIAQGVPIPAITYRLGHKDTKTTMNFYLKVTPDIEKQLLEGVLWR